MSNSPIPRHPDADQDLYTRIAIWWAWVAPRRKALYVLIAFSAFLVVTNGLPFWSMGADSANLWMLHFYLWCVGITGWLLLWRTKNHPMSKKDIVKWMVFGPIGLAIVLGILIVFTASRTWGNN